MSESSKTSVVFITAPRALTTEQRANITAAVEGQVPANVGVVVLDPGFTIQEVGGSLLAAVNESLRRIELSATMSSGYLKRLTEVGRVIAAA